jgi:protein-disulfide isomerase
MMMTTDNRAFSTASMCVFLIAAASLANAQADLTEAAKTQNGAKADAVANRIPDNMPREISEAILKELRQIRILLERQQQAQPTALTAQVPKVENVRVSSDGYSLGQSDAPLTLVEFTDYQCPFCKQFHTAAFDQLKKNYIDTGKLRFVSRDLPLDMHPNAFGAAQAARCAGEQNNFWQMREILIAHSDELGAEAVVTYARQLGLELPRFRACLDSGKYLLIIRDDIADAGSAGIYGTPTFVLGRASGGGVEGMKIVGTQPYESFEKTLAEYSAKQAALKSKGQ